MQFPVIQDFEGEYWEKDSARRNVHVSRIKAAAPPYAEKGGWLLTQGFWGRNSVIRLLDDSYHIIGVNLIIRTLSNTGMLCLN